MAHKSVTETSIQQTRRAPFKSGDEATGRTSGKAAPTEARGKMARNESALVPPSRVIIDRIRPEIDGGKFAARLYIDQEVEVEAVLIVDGHDKPKGRLFYRHEDAKAWQWTLLKDKGNDIWTARFKPEKLGRYLVTVEAAVDRFTTWRMDLKKRVAAGQNVQVDLQIGILLIESWIPELLDDREKRLVGAAMAQLNDLSKGESFDEASISAVLDDPALKAIGDKLFDQKSLVRFEREIPLQIEPVIARFSSWYEFFPRSASNEPGRHGTFRDAAEKLEHVKEMGFDVVYFPPIHPIGVQFRKGKNNVLTTEAGDVGSPWAIGGKEGGHTALHPDLGTFADFNFLLSRAKKLGIEIAMDIAFQCSPDHPYVKEHPEWFKKRPDGTIQYAENPPKKYQDIYPFDFECADWRGLWEELKNVVQFWVDRGVRVFRVDNPHTKPFHFWEWLINEIRSERPDVIFLAEAFTRPHVMAYLAKSGFSQSYTYFTWRNLKWEIEQYMNELTQTELIDYFGANFWPNTPDILPESLQIGGRPAFMQRVILAATLSSNYGVYGPAFEHMEWKPRHEGSEEYLDSEKYQLRHWDWKREDSLAPLLQRLNQIRREQTALQSNRGFRFHPTTNDKIVAYSKSTENGERVLVVVNLDPHHKQSGTVELPLIDWKIDENETFQVHDQLTDARYFWSGWRNYVELDPHSLPAHIFVIKRRAHAVSEFDYFH